MPRIKIGLSEGAGQLKVPYKRETIRTFILRIDILSLSKSVGVEIYYDPRYLERLRVASWGKSLESLVMMCSLIS